jgi:Ser/Thr protein kinase RdoA (MazF antagonist)
MATWPLGCLKTLALKKAKHSMVAFESLNSERILAAVESCGLEVTGRFYALNSMENRVFNVEVEPHSLPKEHPMRGSKKPVGVILKVYRPGRWDIPTLLSEHALSQALAQEGVPTPSFFPVNAGVYSKLKVTSFRSSLGQIQEYFFCVSEKIMGKPAMELSPSDLNRIGRSIGMMHTVFEEQNLAQNFHRHTMSTQNMIFKPLEFLQKSPCVPGWLGRSLFPLMENLGKGLHWVNQCCSFVPVHGDLHRLNLMQTEQNGVFWFLDFDDCLFAPEIQDLWLLASGVDWGEEGKGQTPLRVLIEGYEELRKFPEGMEDLVEPLRTFRQIYYPGWLASRWEDPLFPSTFPFFREEKYWESLLQDLESQQQSLELLGLLDFA